MSWSSIVGHEQVIGRLRSAIEASRLHPVLLFEGPEGVGKRRVALTLAQAHHCPSASSRAGDPCGTCPTCRAIAGSADVDIVEENQSRHAGVRVVSPSRPDEREARFGGASSRGDVRSQITVPQIRVVLSETLARNARGPARFVILDPADRMGDSAANALLKTLEEPSPTERFVLLTSKPSALLPTIRSRCVHFRFGLLSPSDVRRALGATRDAGADVDLIASLSGGRVGHALRLSEPRALEGFREMRSLLLDSLEALARGLPPGTFSIVAGAAFRGRERDAWHEGIGVLEILLRDIAVLSADPGTQVVNVDLRPRLTALAPSLGAGASRALLALDAVRSDLRWNVNARLAAERILIEVAR